MDVNVDLKVDRTKVDSRFEGYKLFLDSLPVHSRTLEAGSEKLSLSEEQYSLQHVKAFGTVNGLTSDFEKNDKIYFIDENWRVFTLETKDDVIGNPKPVLTLPFLDKRASCPERVAVSMVFASSRHVFVADGTGNLHIVNSSGVDDWKIEHSCQPIAKSTPFTAVAAAKYEEEDVTRVSIVLIYVVKEEDEKIKAAFKTVLEWLTFIQASDGWQLHRSRRLEGHACPDYVALERKDDAILLAVEKPMTFVFDSLKPIVQDEEGEGWQVEDVQVEDPTYTWTQNLGEVNLYFQLTESTCKDDISVTVRATSLEVKVKGETLLCGDLEHEVKVDDSTWIITDDKKLNVVMHKCSPDTAWATVVVGDNQGKEEVDPEHAAAISEQLSEYTTEKQAEASTDSAYGTYQKFQQLEECDSEQSDTAVLLRFDGDTHKITHKVNVGIHQWLFNTRQRLDQPACLCLRHDVDGIVWRPDPAPEAKQCPWHHIATFNAFGYVIASKTSRKFCSCAPDFSYVAVSDAHRHVYVYRQPSGIDTPVRNRKTGQAITEVAKQQVISLESTDEISGMAVSNEWIYLLLSTTIYAVKTKTTS